MSRAEIIAGLLALTTTLVAPAGALAMPRTHDGFQLRPTLGFSYLADAAHAGSSEGPAGTMELFAGRTISTAITYGGSLGATVGTPGADRPSMFWTISPYLDWYPDARGGLHLLGTAGPGLLVTRRSVANAATIGLAVGPGIGYEGWIDAEWSAGVLVRLQYMHGSFGTDRGDVSVDLLATTVAASFVYQ